MKAIALTSKGIAAVAAAEIQEHIGVAASAHEEHVLFDIGKLEDLAGLCYTSQSVDKILFLLKDFSFTEAAFEENFEKAVSGIEWKKWLKKNASFKIGAKNAFCQYTELAEKTADILIRKLGSFSLKVDFSQPDLCLFFYFDGNTCYFCVDFSGNELYKRGYKIFAHPGALRGTIAYAAVRFADMKASDVLLDPFSGSGTISIEAAFYLSRFPLNYFNKDKWAFLKLKPFEGFDFGSFFKKMDAQAVDKELSIYGTDYLLASVTMAKKNAKIGGVNKYLHFTKMDVQWLDTKWEKSSVDRIITHPPEASKHKNPKKIEKLYESFFYNADFILKENGKIAVISRDTGLLKKAASKYRFRLVDEKSVFSGQQELKMALFSR